MTHASQPDQRPTDRRRRIGVAALVLLTLAVRTGVLAGRPAFVDDPDGYRRLAVNLVERGTFGDGDRPTAYRPPLYSLLLAPCVAAGQFSPLAIGGLHLLLGLATVLFTYGIARGLGLGNGALIAGGLVACDPILLNQSALVMTETAAAFFAATVLWYLVRAETAEKAEWRWLVAAGVLVGLASLCRPTFLPWIGCIAVVLLMPPREWHVASGASTARRRAVALRGLRALTLVGVAVVVLAPWVIRNQIQFDRPIVATTHGGYTLALANNRWFYEHIREGRWREVWDADEFQAALERRFAEAGAGDEVSRDRVASREGWNAIAAEPTMFLASAAVRIGRLWSPVPHRHSHDEGSRRRMLRYAVGVWYAVEYCLAAVGIWAIGRASLSRPWIYGLSLVAVFTAVHAVYWSDLRMRAPLMPVVAIAAAAGCSRLCLLWHGLPNVPRR